MSSFNNLLRLLAGDRALPVNWGFPPLPLVKVSPVAGALRNALMFLTDQDGTAQLVRWYFGLVKASPAAWRTLSGLEGYDPSFRYLPAVSSPSLPLTRSPGNGMLWLGWTPGPETSGVSGSVTFENDSGLLSLGRETHPLFLTEATDSGVIEVQWPAFLQLSAGLLDFENGSTHLITFRPSKFDLAAVVEAVRNHEAAMNDAGVLDSFLSLPRLEDKLAVAWLAVAKLESMS